MPLQRIDLAHGRPETERRAIADAVHRALVETIGVPPDDRFQVITEHPQGGLVITPAYLGIRYQDPVLIQVTISVGRSTEQKQRLYRGAARGGGRRSLGRRREPRRGPAGRLVVRERRRAVRRGHQFVRTNSAVRAAASPADRRNPPKN
jgi:phenylpyruvate tautomerase PptA (4-oxalocrotonate tautomerase family)